MLNDRRLGKFTITVEAINDAPEVVCAIMGQTIILRAEARLSSNSIEYEALCEHFDDVPEGDLLPEYDVLYDGETETITWVRQE